MQPKPNTVFLVDQNCKIADVKMTEDLKSLADKARTMADAVQEARYALYEGY